MHRTYYDDYKTNLPVVLTVYDLIHEKYYDLYGKDKGYRPKKKAIERADRIICISKNTLNDLGYYYDIRNKKTDIIYLGSDLLNFDSHQQINIKNYDYRYLLFVGKRTGYKNFISLLKAYSNSKKLQKDFKIKCFGGGKPSKNEIDLLNSFKIPLDCIEFISGDDIEQLVYIKMLVH